MYFVSDVHLGHRSENHIRREAMFVDFLKSINNPSTQALYLLGDIWDFWYEWRHTVPKGYVRVFSALMDLMDAGIKVYYTEGNHDIWTYSYFSELGMEYLPQPIFREFGGRKFCLLHGDRICFTSAKYRFMEWLFRNRVIQWMFGSLIHPTFAMELGNIMISNNHLARVKPYVWKGQEEPIVKYAEGVLAERDVDWFICGHLHVKVDQPLSKGAHLMVLDSWAEGCAAVAFDCSTGKFVE